MLHLRGVTTNNLKSIDVTFNTERITVVVGRSGTGKTSLAFHSLYALCKNELDTISGKPSTLRPEVFSYTNLIPAVALKQRNYNVNPRSSIFTYLGFDKLLFHIFIQHNPSLKRNILAPNNPANYCEYCAGVGTIQRPDMAKIVDLNKPLNAKPFISWNNFIAGYYTPLLEVFCFTHGIDMTKSISQLPTNQQEMLLHNSDKTLYLVKYKQKNRYRQKKMPFIGAYQEIQDCCDNFHVPGNRQRSKSYISTDICPHCKGSRFATHLAEYKLNGWTIHDIMSAYFEDLLPFIQKNFISSFNTKKLERIITNLLNNNLGYLSPMRSIPSLSGGEFQRLQLAAILSSEFSNLLYVIDEVSSSLHVSEYPNVLTQLQSLKEKKSTIIMVEHELEFIEKADKIIALEDGKLADSVSWIKSQQDVTINREKRPPKKGQTFEINNVNNIDHIQITIPYGCLVGCCGVSGSGKSSFAEYISRYDGIEYISQGTIQGNSNSTIATYLKLIQPIDSLLSKRLGTTPKTFSFNHKESQCPECEGKGFVEQEALFNYRFRTICEACEGKRYNTETLNHNFDGYNIHDILSLTVSDLISKKVFSDSKTITTRLLDMDSIGLGHLTLFRPTYELSGGEAQRIKLLSQMKSNLKNTFLIIDEPANGLERHDTKLLVNFLDKLIVKAKGIMVIEHSAFLLRNMDYIVEFGPGGGNKGGKIIYQGRLDEIKNNVSQSIIKNYL